MKKIIWINGAFGSGKTTLATELQKTIPDSIIFDPELVGFMIREIVPPASSNDFQDLPIWRRLVAANLLELIDEYNCTIIVPMTIVSLSYLEEIFKNLKNNRVLLDHYFLGIEKQILKERIKNQVVVEDNHEKDSKVRAWRFAQIDRCLDFVPNIPSETILLDSGNRSVSQLVDLILQNSRLFPNTCNSDR